MIVIFVSGGPCSGRTTTAKTIYDYVTENTDVNAVIVDRGNSGRFNPEKVHYNIYRTVVEGTHDFVIIDGIAYDSYERAELMGTIKRAAEVAGVSKLYFVAVNCARSDGFMYHCNKEKGHRPYSSSQLRHALVKWQQPVASEGYGAIVQVRDCQYLSLDWFIKCVNNSCGTSFPIPTDTDSESPADTTISVDADAS